MGIVPCRTSSNFKARRCRGRPYLHPVYFGKVSYRSARGRVWESLENLKIKEAGGEFNERMFPESNRAVVVS